MNKKERMSAVLRGQAPDRAPMGFWSHVPFTGKESVEAHAAFYRKADTDFIKIMSDGVPYPLQGAEDIDGWRAVRSLPRGHSFFSDSVARCGRINDAVGGECVTFFNVFSPLHILLHSPFCMRLAAQGGNAAVGACLQQNRAVFASAMAYIAEDLARLAEGVVHTGGCLGVYQGVQGADGRFLTGELYGELVSPVERTLLERENACSPFNILHMCSGEGYPNDLSLWKDYPARVKNWGTGVEGKPLWAGEDCFGPEAIPLGGLDNRPGKPLCGGTKEALQAAVKQLLKNMNGKPFILGADCTIPEDFPAERFAWIREALETGTERGG